MSGNGRSAVPLRGEVSLFAIGSVILRRRGLVLLSMLAGALLLLLPSLIRAPQYVASASFAPLGNDAAKNGLTALASQFGIAVPIGSSSQSAEFYAELLESRVVLQPIATDSFLPPQTNRPVPLTELLHPEVTPAAAQLEATIRTLNDRIKTQVSGTGVVSIEVSSPWRSVSLAITERLLTQLNEFNLHTRREQASAERRFVESRLKVAKQELRVAEDQLIDFVRRNRQWQGAPDLVFTQQRLQRDVALRSGVVTTLANALEDVRLREVRDVPVIGVVEPPVAKVWPKGRGRILRVVLGLLLGGAIGILIAFAAAALSRGRGTSDPDAEEFWNLADEFRRDLNRFSIRRRANI